MSTLLVALTAIDYEQEIDKSTKGSQCMKERRDHGSQGHIADTLCCCLAIISDAEDSETRRTPTHCDTAALVNSQVLPTRVDGVPGAITAINNIVSASPCLNEIAPADHYVVHRARDGNWLPL